ncbi:DUF4184 family protein [Methylosoma difficile]
MPFTVSHAAAVLPIPNLLGKHVSLSALIIGSLSPDLPYFLHLFTGAFSHTLPGIILLCLPLGLACYLLFHGICKRPATALLPDFLSARLAPQVFDAPLWPKTSFITVVFSIVLGALTHIGWDAFTHYDTPVTLRFAFFQQPVFTVAGHPLLMYKLLQYLSSIFGLLVIARWIRQWLLITPIPSQHPQQLGRRLRYGIILGLCLTGLIAAIPSGLAAKPYSYEWLLFNIITSSINGLGIGFGAYCLLWYGRYFLGRGTQVEP